MKLYFSPGTCSLASDISLHEAGIAFEAVQVDLKTKKTTAGEDYLAINPKGYVPALGLNTGEVLTENAAILQYIADLNPESKLAPTWGTLERYRLVEWLALINSEIHKSLSTFFKPNAGEDWKQASRDNVTKRLDYIQTALSSRQFLMGDQFTVADAYLFTVLRWLRSAQLDPAQWPTIKTYFERIKARPQVVAAMTLEGMVKK